MKYYLWTIGCQMNFADSRQAAEELDRMGFRQAVRPEEADLILLNTCVVRQSAEDKVTGRLTSLQGLKRRRPCLHLALMGCFVQDLPSMPSSHPPTSMPSSSSRSRPKPVEDGHGARSSR
jgi:tRNA-2-methylthio-N6-dimethylallyladenosine synthase